MEPQYGDVVKINDGIYLYLEDGYHDINGGGVLEDKPYISELQMNIGVALNDYVNSKTGKMEYQIAQIKNILES